MDLVKDLLIPVIKIFVILNVMLVSVALLVWAERRVSAFIQDRLGPNRVGPLGLLQSIADLLKFIFKEDVVPGHVNKPFFVLAPALTVVPPLVTIAVVPFAQNLMIADIDTGILFVFAISSLGVYGMTLGGWASNSKYSLIGGVRASAQMVSYEICLGLSVVGIFLLAKTLRLNDIVLMQADGIHPTALAQPILAQKVEHLMQQILTHQAMSQAGVNPLPGDPAQASDQAT